MNISVITFPGLEPILASELKDLEIESIQPLPHLVKCSGDLSIIYRLNLFVRTGLRVLWELHVARVWSTQDLYKEARSIPWETFIDPHRTLAVFFTSSDARWISPTYAPLLVKDAVADRFMQKYGKRPSVDTRAPDLPIHLHLEGPKATFSLDTSGESLHRRGYRTEKTEAPLSEVLAAGILKLIGWHPGVPLYDPMCGSGTFLVEAGLMAYGIAPGILRTRFAFQNWKVFDNALYEKIRREWETPPLKEIPRRGHVGDKDHTSQNGDGTPRNTRGHGYKRARGDNEGKEFPTGCAIFGSDKDPKAIGIAKRNLIRAGLGGKVEVFPGAFESLSPPFPPSRGGMLIVNPPYGKRLEDPSILALYKSIGDTLKQRYPGTEAWILSANPDALKQIGLRPFKKYALKNGPLDCKLVGFTVYNGSLRTR